MYVNILNTYINLFKKLIFLGIFFPSIPIYEKFKQFVNILRKNCITNKCNATRILRFIIKVKL